MLLIECPYCGPRASEFSCGGEADIARPLHPEQLTDREWGDYLFMRRNPVARIASSGCTRRVAAAGSGAARYRQLPDPGL